SVSQVAGNSPLFTYGYGGYGLGIFDNGDLYLTRVGIDNVSVSTGLGDTNYHHVAVTKSGNVVLFYVDGVAYPAPEYNSTFTFDTDAAIGARGDNLDCGFLGTIDEVSVYNRALATNEIQAIYNASVSGKCPVPPVILVQPANQSVFLGDIVTFSVLASGTRPLNYQW